MFIKEKNIKTNTKKKDKFIIRFLKKICKRENKNSDFLRKENITGIFF